MDLKLTDADGLANLDDSERAMIVLEISRREIEDCNISSALESLHVITDSELNVKRFKESLLFQVSGYDDDPRDLPEIPEVRRYFARLNEEWPHWLWFLVRGMGSVALLLALLCKVKVHKHKGIGKYGTEFPDMQQLQDTIKDLFKRGNALFDAYPAIAQEEISESANTAVAEIIKG